VFFNSPGLPGIWKRVSETEEQVYDPKELLRHPVLQLSSDLKAAIEQGYDPLVNTAFSHDLRFLAVSVQLEAGCCILVKDLIEKTFTPFLVSGVSEFCSFDRCYGLYFTEIDQDLQTSRKVYRADLAPTTDEELKILEETRTHITKVASVRGKVVYVEEDAGWEVTGKD
jgi:hypothetical protein